MKILVHGNRELITKYLNGGYSFRAKEWAEAKRTCFIVVKSIFEESFCESLKTPKGIVYRKINGYWGGHG